MPVIIRAILPAEVPLVPAIERAAASRFRDVGLDAVADGAVSPEAFVHAIRRKGVAIGAFADDRLVGFVLAAPLDDALHIYELSVLPDCGGRGIGSGLLAAVDTAARDRGLGAVSLSTFADVPWNAPFYSRRGYRPVDGADWGPAFHLLHHVEGAAGLPLERRVFMRKDLAR